MNVSGAWYDTWTHTRMFTMQVLRTPPLISDTHEESPTSHSMHAEGYTTRISLVVDPPLPVIDPVPSQPSPEEEEEETPTGEGRVASFGFGRDDGRWRCWKRALVASTCGQNDDIDATWYAIAL